MPTDPRGAAALRPAPPVLSRHHRIGLTALAGLLTLTFATSACGSSADDGTATDDTESPAADGFPLTIDNCGEKITVDQAPTRAVTLNQGATEIMLALGLEESMVGTAYIDDAVLPKYQAVYESVPVLSDEYPSQEVLLAEGPDFVYSSYVSGFEDEAAGDRGYLADQGIASYLSPNDCQADAGKPVTFDDVFAEIREIGTVFGVSDRAEALITESQARLETAAEGLPDDISIFWYDSKADAPFTAGCCGAPAMIMEAVGATNVFADLDGGWADGSWETAVAADPDVIVLIEADWDTVEAKRDVLATEPMASMRAVQDQRYVELAFSSTTPGVRNVDAVEALAERLRQLPPA